MNNSTRAFALLFLSIIINTTAYAQAETQTICSNQTLPDGYVVTRLSTTSACTFSGQGDHNTLEISLPASGVHVCGSYPVNSTAHHFTNIPEGFVVSSLTQSSSCQFSKAAAKNTLVLVVPDSGEIVCGSHPVSSTTHHFTDIPEGYVVSELTTKLSCGYTGSATKNALILERPVAGLSVCGSYPVSSTTHHYTVVPEGFVVSELTARFSCSYSGSATKNALILKVPVSGLSVCGSYPVSSTTHHFVDVPEGFVVSELAARFACNYSGSATKNALVLKMPTAGLSVCGSYPVSSTTRHHIDVPENFIVSELTTKSSCSYTGSATKNALILKIPAPGLSVCGSYPVSSTARRFIDVPEGFVVSELTTKSSCDFIGSAVENTLVLDMPSSGGHACGSFPVSSTLSRGIMVPDGYVVSALTSESVCAYSRAADKNALVLVPLSPGIQVCGSYPIFSNSSFSPHIPSGYVVTALSETSACEHGIFEPTKNTLTLELPSSDMDVCGSFPSSSSGALTISIPSDFIVTSFRSTDLCSHPLDGDSNTLKLISPVDGANMCRSYPHARNVYTRSEVPSDFSVTENINTNECEHLFDFSYNTSVLQSLGGSGDDPDPDPQVAESYDWLVPIIALILY